MKTFMTREYLTFLNEIKSRIVVARIQAIRSVNKELINLYWDIGKTIVERQEQFGWGKGYSLCSMFFYGNGTRTRF